MISIFSLHHGNERWFSRIAKVARIIAIGSCLPLVASYTLSPDRTLQRLALAFAFFCWTSWTAARWFELRCAMGTPKKE